jgi:hypothetical protein
VRRLALSRASPLPQWIAFLQNNPVSCGSGLAREEALKNDTHLKPAKKNANPKAGVF